MESIGEDGVIAQYLRVFCAFAQYIYSLGPQTKTLNEFSSLLKRILPNALNAGLAASMHQYLDLFLFLYTFLLPPPKMLCFCSRLLKKFKQVLITFSGNVDIVTKNKLYHFGGNLDPHLDPDIFKGSLSTVILVSTCRFTDTVIFV